MTDEIIMITDPLLARKMDKSMNTNFCYKKLGDKYTLFSVGIDGEPNTADDIFPQILESDRDKFGFIKTE